MVNRQMERCSVVKRSRITPQHRIPCQANNASCGNLVVVFTKINNFPTQTYPFLWYYYIIIKPHYENKQGCLLNVVITDNNVNAQ